jgi:hypothetical protein
MNLEICVMTHAIPNAIRIAIPAMVVLAVKQSVFVRNGLLQTYPSITMSTLDVLTIVLGHGSLLTFLGLVHGQAVKRIKVVQTILRT